MVRVCGGGSEVNGHMPRAFVCLGRSLYHGQGASFTTSTLLGFSEGFLSGHGSTWV